MGTYIIDGFMDRAIVRGDVPWFRPRDAIQIIETAKRLGAPLLKFDAGGLIGVDAFQLSRRQLG